MIDVRSHEKGATLPVWANPGSRKNRIVDEYNQSLRVAVQVPPEDGKANQAIVAVLAKALNLHRSQIELIAGASSRQKRFLIEGILPADLLARIDGVLETTVYEPPDPEL